MKKLLLPVVLAVLILASALAPAALALVEPSGDYYVTDAAGVLTEVTRSDIISANVDLEQKCQGAQIVIVTIDYLTDGLDSEEYATQLFNDWGVGAAEANNGMLLLLVTEEFRGWLVTGAGISGAFNDKMAEDYLNNYFWDLVDAREYDAAVRSICEALFSWYAGYYGVNQGGNQGAYQTPGIVEEYPHHNQTEYYPGTYRPSFFFNVAAMFWIIIFVFVLFIIIGAAGADRRRHRAYYVHMGMPIPPYHWWYMWGHRPHRIWYNNHWRGGPGGRGGPRGPGGSGRPPRGPGGGAGRGGGGGFGGVGGGSGGGFGGFGGGGFGGGGFGGGGGFSGGGGGRR